MNLYTWAARWGVSLAALKDLERDLGLEGVGVMPAKSGISEAAVQSVVRLEAARYGVRLWRNNVGALKDERGVPVRYGLANDSKELNRVIKSGDLIGWRKTLITPDMVGRHVAVFVSREIKEAGWRYKADQHEQAQLRWAQLVIADGGDAKFATGEGSF